MHALKKMLCFVRTSLPQEVSNQSSLKPTCRFSKQILHNIQYIYYTDMDVSLLDEVLTQVEQAEARTRKHDKDTETTQKNTGRVLRTGRERGKGKGACITLKTYFQRIPMLT